MNTYIECGCCGHYHRDDYFGECRDDAERFTLDQLPEGAMIRELVEFDDDPAGAYSEPFPAARIAG